MTWMDLLSGPAPKRGDLVHTNRGKPRERTWMLLRVRRSKRMPKGVPRFHLWMARWWELEPDFRMRLFRSAERAGGQRVFILRRYPAKRKAAHFPGAPARGRW